MVADCYLAGVSTRWADNLVKTLGIDSVSKSHASRRAAEFDQLDDRFGERDFRPITFTFARPQDNRADRSGGTL